MHIGSALCGERYIFKLCRTNSSSKIKEEGCIKDEVYACRVTLNPGFSPGFNEQFGRGVRVDRGSDNGYDAMS